MKKFQLSGNLAADPESGRSATTVARFRVASSGWNASTKSRTTEFFTVTAFGKTAEFVMKYLHKGDGCEITGRLGINEWTDKAGQHRYDIQLTADEVNFPPNSGKGSGAMAAPHTPSFGSTTEPEPEADFDPYRFS